MPDFDLEAEVIRNFHDKAYDMDELVQWGQSIRDRERQAMDRKARDVFNAARKLMTRGQVK